MIKEKTKEDHIQFITDIIKLQLHFVAMWKNNHPEFTVPALISDHSILLNFTDLNSNSLFDNTNCTDDVKWAEIVNSIEKAYVAGIEPEVFVEKTFALMSDCLFGRVDEDMKHFAYLRYNEFRRKGSPIIYDVKSGGDYLYFHSDNTFYPESFLSYPDNYKKHMKDMVIAAEEAGFKGIGGVTWLNHLSFWLKLFPPVWKNSEFAIAIPIGNHLGTWGQFISPDLTINKSMCRKFFKNEDFPYSMTGCRADIADFKKFLDMD